MDVTGLDTRSVSYLAKAAVGRFWYIAEGWLPSIGAVEIDAEVAARVTDSGPRNGRQVAGPVAVVPFYGVVVPRPSLFSALLGGSAVTDLRASMENAVADKDVAAIVAEFDSPGGSVEGIEEFATWIREQRGTKPMVAVANTLATSAAYYLASQFDEIVASPSSLTGSIGVYTDHVEFAGANESDGIKPTRVRAPATKGDVNEIEPLTDEARTHLQSLVDDYYGQFVGAVAKGRGVPATAVREGYGQGRELTATRAKAAGLVDRIDTLDNTVRRLASGRGRAAMAPRSTGPALRRSLEVVEAAFRGGYALSNQGGNRNA